MASGLKVLMVNYEFPPIGGGAGNAHLALLREYSGKSDLEVDVLTSAPRPGFTREEFSRNVRIYRVGLHKRSLHFWRKTEVLEWLLKAGRHYRRLVKQNRYDLAHAFFGFPSGWACYRGAGNPAYMISLRGSDVPGVHARLRHEYRILGPAFKAIWRRAAALVACSEGLKKRALRFMPSAAIEVIPNGVDVERFHPAPRRKRPEGLRLITVGRLSVTKRVELLIDAMEILHRDGSKAELTIVGGGALEGRLRRYASQKDLRGAVRITGRAEADEMPRLYWESDVFVSATEQEGMSNAMLEAMASGLPIVTTRCEGVEELIADNGVVVEDADGADIAEAIRGLAEEGRRRRMGEAGRKRAEELTWARAAGRYVECYRRIPHYRRADSES